jgi:hypothetical protein
MAAINDNVIGAGYFWDSVNRKTYSLIGGCEQVEQHKGNGNEIDEGRRQYHQDSRVQQVGKQTDSQRGMLTKDFP